MFLGFSRPHAATVTPIAERLVFRDVADESARFGRPYLHLGHPVFVLIHFSHFGHFTIAILTASKGN